MADKEIADLTSGGDATAGDIFHAVRGGNSRKVAFPTVSAFASGTRMLFQQTAAPTGWTKDTTHNDKALRIVSGSVSSGGSVAFSTVFGKTSTDNTTLTTTTMPAHTHPQQSDTVLGTSTTQAGGSGFVQGRGGTTQSTGSGSAHAHGMDIRVQYVDVIIAEKD